MTIDAVQFWLAGCGSRVRNGEAYCLHWEACRLAVSFIDV
jgi:hypothetical protein